VTRSSALYTGTLRHSRRGPVAHAFAYRLHMLYLDLDELPELLAGPGPIRAGRFGLLSFWRGDYLAGAPSLAEAARDRVEQELGVRPAGPVRLLTHVRSLGRVFNPVSFYYLFGRDGRTLEAVLAEITNTPWFERHAYALRADGAAARASFPKRFHVSPFFGMEQTYHWSLPAPDQRLTVEMRNEEAGDEVFRATLALERRPWSAAELWRAALATPLVSWKVHAAIYVQALLLWAKRTPFHVHPAKHSALPARRS
jgi:uncharacterized protein